MSSGAILLDPEATQERGENARLSSFVGAIAVTDLVKTTLGPKGMDKILQSTQHANELQVTNDGATILRSVHVDNAAAKVLIDISKTQDDEVGDGTTSVCVLAGELLREAERLVEKKIHPQTIIAGWRVAREAALKALVASARNNKDNEELFRKDLLNIAMTTLSSKILSSDKQHFAELVVSAVLRLKGSTDLNQIHIIKKLGGSVRDSFVDEGFILEKKLGVGQPKRIENPKILIANTAMDTDKIKIFGAKVKVGSVAQLAKIEQTEKDRMWQKCDKIKAHGADVFINRQLIYNLAEQYFTDNGMICIEHADFDGVERLALVTGGEIVSTFDNPERVALGGCKLIEEIMIGEDKLLHFSGVPKAEACTIVLRGSTTHLLEEAERSVHDALCVVSQTAATDTRVVVGAGCSETLMANACEEIAKETPGKRSIAIEAYARALRQLPTIIADNAGYDSTELVAQLRAEHYKGKSTTGLNMTDGTIYDALEAGILEPYKSKSQIVISASEAAEMILRVDDIIRCAPRRREQQRMPGM